MNVAEFLTQRGFDVEWLAACLLEYQESMNLASHFDDPIQYIEQMSVYDALGDFAKKIITTDDDPRG